MSRAKQPKGKTFQLQSRKEIITTTIGIAN